MQIDLGGTVVGEFPRDERPQLSQTKLIKAIAAGDKRAMQVLFAQHRLRVYRFALRLLDDRDGAEDLVSEVFLDVWRHAGRFEGRCQISTWLLAITRNLALSVLRRRRLDRLDGVQSAAIPDHADNPETVLQKQQQSAILALCLAELSPAHREVIDLVYYHGRSIDEVAAIIRVPPSTVKTRMFYARNRIAKLIRGFGMHRPRHVAKASPCKRQARDARTRAMPASIH
jgi:RNA polymerase sigma-70 factor (ECF subfamily)